MSMGRRYKKIGRMLERFGETPDQKCGGCVHLKSNHCYLFQNTFMPKTMFKDATNWRVGYPACGRYQKPGEAPIRTAINRAIALAAANNKTFLFDMEDGE